MTYLCNHTLSVQLIKQTELSEFTPPPPPPPYIPPWTTPTFK